MKGQGMYDLIGDIHGHASALEALLARLVCKSYAPMPAERLRRPICS